MLTYRPHPPEAPELEQLIHILKSPSLCLANKEIGKDTEQKTKLAKNVYAPHSGVLNEWMCEGPKPVSTTTSELYG
jgi:hypothetical protein